MCCSQDTFWSPVVYQCGPGCFQDHFSPPSMTIFIRPSTEVFRPIASKFQVLQNSHSNTPCGFLPLFQTWITFSSVSFWNGSWNLLEWSLFDLLPFASPKQPFTHSIYVPYLITNVSDYVRILHGSCMFDGQPVTASHVDPSLSNGIIGSIRAAKFQLQKMHG